MPKFVVSKALVLPLAFTMFLGTLASIPKVVAAVNSQASLAPLKFVREDKSSGIKEYRLNSNGLKVLLQEKHSAPVVVVMVLYKVGSRNEAVGFTGSTHFLEHMMFKGTAKHDPLKGTGLDDVLKPIGGVNNATTSFDRTNYFEAVPSKNLDVCLEMEADRMRNALLRADDRKSEMTVVRNELERGENSAEEILNIQLFATAFREHPYHHPTIGWRSDVEGVPTERLKQFYNDFYYPDNATLIVVGDFSTPEALKLIQKNFGRVPRSPKPFPSVYTVEPPQEGERRFTVQRGDEMPKLAIGYHIPAAKDKDTYPLEVLASLLGDQTRQSSRLYKKLVDSGLASQAYAYNNSLKDPGLFYIGASATSGTKLETLEKAIKDELAELAKSPISEAELDRAKKAVWKKLKLQTDDPMYFAMQLSEAEALADWTWWLNLEKNIKAVSAADLQRVAKKYFASANCSVGYYLPKEKDSSKSGSASNSQINYLEPEQVKSSTIKSRKSLDPESEALLLAENSGASKKTPLAMAVPAASGSRALVAERTRKKVLSNGMLAYVMPVPGSGIVAVSGKLKGGESLAPGGKKLIPELLADMLNKGSASLSKEELADTLELMGASIDSNVMRFWTDFESEVVSEDLDKFLGTFSESLRKPLLKQEELDKLKKQKEAELKDAMVDTEHVAENKLYGKLYKSNCVYYEKPFEEQLEELNKITVDDLRELHRSNFKANNMVLALVGDLTAEQGFAMLEKHFGDWEKGESEKPSMSNCKCDTSSLKSEKIETLIPDKSNVDIVMGYPANVSIKSRDFAAAQVVNSALGHDTISSRLAALREKHGLTYGITSSFAETAESFAPWEVDLSVNPENTEKSLKLVREILADYYAKGISARELELEKQRLAGEYVVQRMRSPKRLADALSKYGALGLGPEFMDRYPELLNSVSLKDANAAIKQYMNPDRLLTSLAGSIREKNKSK